MAFRAHQDNPRWPPYCKVLNHIGETLFLNMKTFTGPTDWDMAQSLGAIYQVTWPQCLLQPTRLFRVT